MIARIRGSLAALLLGLLAVVVAGVGWKAISVLDRIEQAAILTEDTLRIGRAALAEQRIYYRALSKMAVRDANRLGKTITAAEEAIRNEDARLAASHRQLDQFVVELQRTAAAGTKTIGEVGEVSVALGRQVDALGGDSRRLLAQGATVLATVDERLKDPSLAQTAANLAQSSANLERMSLAGAESAEHIRDMLSPKKRSFWMRLFELMIPRPTVRIAR
jgi:hypothetical protein